MADWPTLDELKQVLDVTGPEWDGDGDDTRLEGVRLAAIEKVKRDTGAWDEDTSEPDVSLSRAALRMAELMATRPGAASSSFTERSAAVAVDPTYARYLYGHRQRFGIG